MGRFGNEYLAESVGYNNGQGLMSAASLIATHLNGVVSRNRRNFRHPSSSPATSASRSMTLPSLWKV
jgi:hypothetical protein